MLDQASCLQVPMYAKEKILSLLTVSQDAPGDPLAAHLLAVENPLHVDHHSGSSRYVKAMIHSSGILPAIRPHVCYACPTVFACVHRSELSGEL